MHRIVRWLMVSAACVAGASGCRFGESVEGRRTPLVVFAASSLTESFEALESAFEHMHPEIDVQLAFAGSQVLRLQIEHGAAVDVFASANQEHTRALVEAGHLQRPTIFARNELTVVAPDRNPNVIGRFEDLATANRIVVGTEATPIGRYTDAVLKRAGQRLGADFEAAVRSRIVSKELSVRLVRAKVELGEADAAIVYRTDAAISDRLQTVSIPPSLNVSARYPIGVTTRTRHPQRAGEFVEFIMSKRGRTLLQRHGFTPDAP